MPPFAQDAFTAAHQALQARALAPLVAALSVLAEPWILALVALALFSWLERDVPSVLRVFAPFAAALAFVSAVAISWGGLSSGQALATAAFAGYAISAYGRRALPVLAVALAGGVVRAHAGAAWAFDVLGGWALGAATGSLAWRFALRLWPRGPGSA